MRNMSFALTTPQVLDRSKTVTRRLGWTDAKPGDVVQPVEKCRGLKKGEKVKKIGGPIRFVKVMREPLTHLTVCYDAREELAREGFPAMSPFEFITMFCQHNRACTGSTDVTRIEFEYVD